jgi:hypothetical protein
MAQEEEKPEEKKGGFFKRFGKGAREFIYGMAAHDTTRFALKSRGSMEHLFILITMGDLLGVPIIHCGSCLMSSRTSPPGNEGCFGKET